LVIGVILIAIAELKRYDIKKEVIKIMTSFLLII